MTKTLSIYECGDTEREIFECAAAAAADNDDVVAAAAAALKNVR